MRNSDGVVGFTFYGRGGMNTDWQGGTATFDPDGPGPAQVGTFPGTYGDALFGGEGDVVGQRMFFGKLHEVIVTKIYYWFGDFNHF